MGASNSSKETRTRAVGQHRSTAWRYSTPIALAQGSASGGPAIRLIIADDNRRSRHALDSLLATYPDLKVVGEAADGEQAVTLVQQEHPDIAILDLRMPRMDGIEATSKIKASWPDVRVLILSLATELREQALGAGADRFINKGAAEDMLIEAIRSLRKTT